MWGLVSDAFLDLCKVLRVWEEGAKVGRLVRLDPDPDTMEVIALEAAVGS